MEYFTETVRTGQDGITKAFGKNVFELFADSPEEAAGVQQVDDGVLECGR